MYQKARQKKQEERKVLESTQELQPSPYLATPVEYEIPVEPEQHPNDKIRKKQKERKDSKPESIPEITKNESLPQDLHFTEKTIQKIENQFRNNKDMRQSQHSQRSQKSQNSTPMTFENINNVRNKLTETPKTEELEEEMRDQVLDYLNL